MTVVTGARHDILAEQHLAFAAVASGRLPEHMLLVPTIDRLRPISFVVTACAR